MSELLRAWLLQPVLDFLHQLQRQIEMNQAEELQSLADVQTSLDKIGNETGLLVAQVADLQNKLATAGNVSPEVAAAVANLAATAKRIDDAVPDAAAPVEPSAAEPVDSSAS